MSNFIDIKILDDLILENPSRIQVDKSVIQCLFLKLQLWQYSYKVILVYRVPDTDNFPANSPLTEKLFERIGEFDPHFCLGDFNLDYKNCKIKKRLNEICSLKQIISKPTRIGTTKSGVSKTIIDHIWVKNSISNKFDFKIEDVNFTDHKLVRFTLDVSVPKVKLKIPMTVDKFKRYLPKNIDWKKFPFDFDPTKYSCFETDEYYKDLVASIIRGCEKFHISFRNKLKDKEIERFDLSEKTKSLKSLLKTKKDGQIHFTQVFCICKKVV